MKHTTRSHWRFSFYKGFFCCNDIHTLIHLHMKIFSLQNEYFRHLLLDDKFPFCNSCCKFVVYFTRVIHVGHMTFSTSLFIHSFIPLPLSHLVSWQEIEFFPFSLLLLLTTLVEDYPKAPFAIATIWGVGESATPFLGLLHFTLDPYLIGLCVKQGGIKYHFFESLVCFDLGLNPGLPDHWWTLYLSGQCLGVKAE